MIQHPGRTRFLLEATKPIGVSRERGWKNLDRDIAAQTSVASPINLSHPPSPERGEDFVTTKPFA
jgi:hypothetical protein